MEYQGDFCFLVDIGHQRVHIGRNEIMHIRRRGISDERGEALLFLL